MAQTNTTAARVPRITVIDPRTPEKEKLRVAAYARVSSDSADQLNSYLAQVDFYTKFISSKEDWELVDIYADEGLSGLDSHKREDFNRMIADCQAGKIDRVLVKSTSRFARNTTDYIRYVRELLRLGVSICFEKENIDTGRMTSEQIAQIYTGEITNWKDVGGDDLEISLIGREAGSGTRDGFETITGTKEACKYNQELTSTGDVITTVAGNPNAIGYASLSAVKDSVKALTVGGVAPSEETVLDGTYTIQRPFVLATRTGEALSEAAQAFFDFATSADANEIIAAAGAVPVAK